MIAVSSFSLRSQLGPIRIGYVDEDGAEREFVMPYPAELGLGDFARRARAELGVDAIELCQIQLGDPSGAEIEALRAELDAAGVSVLNMPIDVGDLGSADTARREADLAANERWLGLAGALGCRFARVNAGSPLDAGRPDLDVLVGSLDRLAARADALGLRLLVENHGGASSEAGFLLELVRRVGAERLGILLDLGNFEPMLTLARAALGGEAPDPATLDFAPLFAAIAELAPHAALVHAKSYGFDDAGVPQGLDAERALRVVAAAGYDGPVTIEYEGEQGDPWRNTARTVELVRAAGLG